MWATLAVAIASVVATILIPIRLDDTDTANADREQCISSILTARDGWQAILRDERIDKSNMPTLTADWDSASASLMVLSLSCGVDAIQNGRLLKESVTKSHGSFDQLAVNFRGQLRLAEKGEWSENTVSSLQNLMSWSDWAISRSTP
jgi:hypothetical protein